MAQETNHSEKVMKADVEESFVAEVVRVEADHPQHRELCCEATARTSTPCGSRRGRQHAGTTAAAMPARQASVVTVTPRM